MSATVAPLVSLVAAVARNGVIGRDNGLILCKHNSCCEREDEKYDEALHFRS